MNNEEISLREHVLDKQTEECSFNYGDKHMGSHPV